MSDRLSAIMTPALGLDVNQAARVEMVFRDVRADGILYYLRCPLRVVQDILLRRIRSGLRRRRANHRTTGQTEGEHE